MYKVAVITMGIRLDDEKGYTRFRSVCEFLADAGYQVDLITTTFQHWEKAQRDLEKIKNEKYKFGVKFIYEPGYKKNIDLRRIYSHRIAAKNLMNLLEKEGDYDLLYAEIPPNDVALAAAEYAKKKGIPFVADVNDLWPEAMRMIIDIPVISDIIFYSLLRDAEKVYRLASGVIGTSDEYRDRPFKRRNRDIPRETVYVGNELTVFDAGAAQRTAEIVKDKEEFWVSYAGTIGTSYDIRTMVLAGEELTEQTLVEHPDGNTWLHTGDEAYITEQGIVHILGRGEIKAYGDKPLHVMRMETKTVRTPGVKDGFFCLVPDQEHEGYYRPYLFVILDGTKTLEEVAELLKDTLEEHEYPVEIREITERPYFHFKTDRKGLTAQILKELEQAKEEK